MLANSVATTRPVGGPVSPTVGCGLMAAYAAALVAGAALFARRDT
ncbi:MAG: hypothetical protein M0Z30_08075 [Actinomycetota bacterium]|nr:hypothetical protein [Actinomycetota bacterium]